MRCLCFAFAMASLAGAFAFDALAQGPAAQGDPEDDDGGWSVEVVTEDLNYPWDIDRAGDRILLTEAGGTIVTIEDGR